MASPNPKSRSQFKIPQLIRDKFKKEITHLKIEVSPLKARVVAFCFDNAQDWGYDIEFKPHLEKHVEIKTNTSMEGNVEELPEEFVAQKYTSAALDHLKALFNGLEATTEFDQFQVVVVSDDEFEADKKAFFTSLQNYFKGMANKKLNVKLFGIKYSGEEKDEEEVLTFLSKMKLIGNKQLTFESNSPPHKLCLKETLKLQQWKDARSLMIETSTWTEMPFDNWMHFTASRLGLWDLSVDTVNSIVRNAHSTPNFISCSIRVHSESTKWKSSLLPYFESHFANVYFASETEFPKDYQVITHCENFKFDMSGTVLDDPLKPMDDHRLISINLNADRALLTASTEEYVLEDKYIREQGAGCRSFRKTRRGKDFTYEYNVHKKVNYISKLIEVFRKVLSTLNRLSIVDEFRVSVGWRQAEATSFKTQKDLFLKMIIMAFGDQKIKNAQKRPYIESNICLIVKKFVMEYSGAEEDENIVMAFLVWLQFTDPCEIHFRPHLLDPRERPLTLTKKKGAGVMKTEQWKSLLKFAMFPPFILGTPMMKLLRIPELRVVMESLSVEHVLTLLTYCRYDDSFISCEIKTIERSQNPEIVTMIRGCFQYKNPEETEFRNVQGFQVLLDGNVYTFKGPTQTDSD